MNKKNPIEYKLKKDEILYFLHIQKTAGTTLLSTLRNNFDYDSILYPRGWRDLFEKMPENFSHYRLVTGHFGYSMSIMLPRKPIFITMLRDPVDRVISDYGFFLDRERAQKDGQLKKASLEDLINNPDTRWNFTNIQTRHIGLDRDELSLRNLLMRNSFGLISRWINYRLPDDPPDDRLLEIAMKRLSEFAFVGLVERFEESLFLLCYTFGWRPVRNVTKKNVTSNKIRRDQLSKTVLESISECNRLDRELYRYAQQLFESRYSLMVQELKEKYFQPNFADLPFQEMVYQMLERHYNETFAKSHDIVDSIEYDFGQILVGSGWHDREVIPNTGTKYRWTGPETVSTIDFMLKKDNDLIIQFHVIASAAPDILESLKLRVDGTPIPLYTKSYDGETIFEGIIPKSALSSEKSFTRVGFHVNRTVNTRSNNPDIDDRDLGLSFSWIKIFPADNIYGNTHAKFSSAG